MNRVETRAQAVLRVLRSVQAYNDGWVPGHALTTPQIGGSEGLRRLRELRAAGHNIEMRKGPGATRFYRLVETTQATIW